MRGLVWCALLLSAVGAVGWAQSAKDGSEAVTKLTGEICTAADRLIASGTPEDVAKGAALLEKASAIEQAEMNAKKLATEREKLGREMDDNHASSWKNVQNLTPLLTTIVLAGTLIFQIWQARAERHEKSLAARGGTAYVS